MQRISLGCGDVLHIRLIYIAEPKSDKLTLLLTMMLEPSCWRERRNRIA